MKLPGRKILKNLILNEVCTSCRCNKHLAFFILHLAFFYLASCIFILHLAFLSRNSHFLFRISRFLSRISHFYVAFPSRIFVRALASTMLSSAEFICLRLTIARSSGRNCALAAPGGSRNHYDHFSCKSVLHILHFGAVSLYKFCVFVSGRHCRYFEGKFHSLAVLFLLYRINHRMQVTIKPYKISL